MKLYGGQQGKPIPLIWTKAPVNPCDGRTARVHDPVEGTIWMYLAQSVPESFADRQIAKDLGISFHRTRNLVAMVLKQHRAHGRKELIRMLRPKRSVVAELSGSAPPTRAHAG